MRYQRKITEDLYYLGANDRRLVQFENMFELPQGVCYNSYFLDDEKRVLLDAVDLCVSEPFQENLARALDGRSLDYFVVNHVEPDHCSSINEVLTRYPEATLLISQKGLNLLQQFYHRSYEGRVRVVADGEVIDTGRHKLRFIAAPNVHWPEVTFCYDETDKILFSADAFGSFKAPEGHLFADEVDYERDWLAENRRYYVNIVGAQGASVQRVMKKIAELEIRMICSLHGLIFRTKESIDMICNCYQRWSQYQAEEAGVTIVFGSMYGNSQTLSDLLAGMLAERGVKNIRVYDVSKTDLSYITADCFRFSHAVFVCNNYNTELYPKMDAFLRELRMLKWDQHSFTVLGNMSWGGRGVKIANEILGTARNLEEVGAGFMIKSAVAEEQFEALAGIADAIAEKLSDFR